MQFELAVFDLAGTTVKDNKDVHRVLQSALQKFGVDISTADANAVMGIPKPVAIQKLLTEKMVDNISSDLVDKIHQEFVREMINFYQTDKSVGEKHGVTETFIALKKKGIKVSVETGFDRTITAPLLKRLGWQENDLIDFSITSDEVKRGRPYPDMIFETMKHFGITDAKKVIKIGDTVSDIMEGNAAGCGLVIGITSGAFSEHELVSEQPDYLIESIPEILQLLH